MASLEQSHLFGDGLVYRQAQEGEISQDIGTMLDLDSEDGVESLKGFLCSLERLMVHGLDLSIASREYRQLFSNSYKELYADMLSQYGSRCGYLPEILDSA